MITDLKFILVDDDSFNNILSSIVIEDAFDNADIETFTEPKNALEFILKEYTKSSNHTILFLDINMPKINGWEFLEQYERFGEIVKMQINIYILSSSLDWRDKDKAKANKNVKGFISKPLDFETLTAITDKGFQSVNF